MSQSSVLHIYVHYLVFNGPADVLAPMGAIHDTACKLDMRHKPLQPFPPFEYIRTDHIRIF